MTETSLADILRIEDTPRLLDFVCEETQIAVWPQVRIWLLRQILGDLVYADGGAPDMPMRRPPARAAGTMLRSIWHNTRTLRSNRLPIDVLITTEASVDQLRDGKWFNRQADYFASSIPGSSLVLIDQHEWIWPFPRSNPDVYFHAPLQFATSAMGRAFPGKADMAAAEQLSRLAISRARDMIGWEAGAARTDAFTRYIARKLATTAPRYRAYRRLFARLQPRLLLNSSGCYGHIATMIAAAHDCGIVSAEYQHGAVSEGHDAYNFGAGVRNDTRLLRSLPQYFLSFGDWWGEHFNAPVAKVTIGNPNRDAILARSDSDRPRDPRTILILSDGLEFGFYARLAEDVARAVASRGYTVSLRPHPLERGSVAGRWAPSAANLMLDSEPDIYSSLAGVGAVVSEVSTGLFEAVGIVEKVIMLNTAKARFAYPDAPFGVAANAAEIAEIATSPLTEYRGVTPERLWADNWRDRFRAFCDTEVGSR